jgi:hypothetical protein
MWLLIRRLLLSRDSLGMRLVSKAILGVGAWWVVGLECRQVSFVKLELGGFVWKGPLAFAEVA